MKTSLFFVSTVAILMNLGCNNSSTDSSGPTSGLSAPKTASLNECPALQGEYKNTQHNYIMKIYENRDGGIYKVILGDGAQEMIADGNPHSAQGTQYQAWCEKGVLNIEASDGNKKIIVKNYFSQSGIFVQETSISDGSNSREEWQKIK